MESLLARYAHANAAAFGKLAKGAPFGEKRRRFRKEPHSRKNDHDFRRWQVSRKSISLGMTTTGEGVGHHAKGSHGSCSNA